MKHGRYRTDAKKVEIWPALLSLAVVVAVPFWITFALLTVLVVATIK